MLKLFRFIEILISLQLIFLSTMIPVFITLPFANNINENLHFPITWQIPTVILLTLIFERKVVFSAFTIYILLGLFIVPVFPHGGSLGYLLTPNFGYMIGIYPLIFIIDFLNLKDKINIFDFYKKGILGISTMHFIGIIYNLIQIIYYKNINVFLYNIGKYSFGKLGYHLLMLIPLFFIAKPIMRIKYKLL